MNKSREERLRLSISDQDRIISRQEEKIKELELDLKLLGLSSSGWGVIKDSIANVKNEMTNSLKLKNKFEESLKNA